MQEKEQLEEAFEEFKCQVAHSQDRKGSKEIRVLKKVIKNLEVHNTSVVIVKINTVVLGRVAKGTF